MGADKTEDMLEQGGWTEWCALQLLQPRFFSNTLSRPIPSTPSDGPKVFSALSGYDQLPDAGEYVPYFCDGIVYVYG